MNDRKLLAGTTAVLLAAATASANINIAIDHNTSDTATPAFKFHNVPSPSASDAATRGSFAIVAGRRDQNGAGVGALHDGRLPGEADEPDANFFFAAGADGGRLRIDLRRIIHVKQVNTYSWHPGTRGPQVYRLYASDGKGKGFEDSPGQGTDPAQQGWKLIAKVDTRPASGAAGGQYGVSIADDSGTLGNYRYLLLAVSATEDDDNFGNTFYSEIDVIDADAPAVAVEPAVPARAYHPFVVKTTDGKCEITIDTRAAPELRDWAETKLGPVLAEWYPKIVALLPSEGFTAPTHFTVTIRPGRGVAATGGTHVTANSTWLRRELGGEAIGSLVHETVHVVQQYGRARRANPHPAPSPGWLVEGIADYVRWFRYEPQSHGADMVWMRRLRNFSPRYNAGYRVTANFLNWVTEKYDGKIVTELNAAMRNGKYSESLWRQYTGKSLQELGQEWKHALEAQLAAPPAGDASR